MIKGKTIQWHYDACIESWNDTAEQMENGKLYDVYIKDTSPLIMEHKPQNDCFACELYVIECGGCPLLAFI